jgi:hypothetical protein
MSPPIPDEDVMGLPTTTLEMAEKGMHEARNRLAAPWSLPSGNLEMMVRRAQLVIKVAAVGAIIAAVLLFGYLMINR